MNYSAGKFDIAVIGAGHAGIEAALAAAIGVIVVEALGVLSSVAFATQATANDFAKSGKK